MATSSLVNSALAYQAEHDSPPEWPTQKIPTTDLRGQAEGILVPRSPSSGEAVCGLDETPLGAEKTTGG